MLNPFPSLLTYSFLAPTILRLLLGLIAIDLGRLKFGREHERWVASLEALHMKPAGPLVKVFGALELIGGFLLVIGLYTQIAALAFVIMTAAEAYLEWKDATLLKRNFVFYSLLLAIALSLLLTGAGAFAFDIPL